MASVEAPSGERSVPIEEQEIALADRVMNLAKEHLLTPFPNLESITLQDPTDRKDWTIDPRMIDDEDGTLESVDMRTVGANSRIKESFAISVTRDFDMPTQVRAQHRMNEKIVDEPTRETIQSAEARFVSLLGLAPATEADPHSS